MISEPKEIKIEATLNCIKDSETILNGEYYVVHSDFIVALEEEIEKLNQPNIIVKIGDAKEVREKIEQLQQEVREKIEQLQQEIQRKDNIINGLKGYVEMCINATFNMNNDKYNEGRYNAYCNILDKLNKLRGK